MIGQNYTKRITFKYLINNVFFIASNFIKIFMSASIFLCNEEKSEKKNSRKKRTMQFGLSSYSSKMDSAIIPKRK